jgi:hypothetical protein
MLDAINLEFVADYILKVGSWTSTVDMTSSKMSRH